MSTFLAVDVFFGMKFKHSDCGVLVKRFGHENTRAWIYNPTRKELELLATWALDVTRHSDEWVRPAYDGWGVTIKKEE